MTDQKLPEDEKVVLAAVTEAVEVPLGVIKEKGFDRESWTPVTVLGRAVKSGEVTDIESVLNSGRAILEAEIVDCLLSNLESDLLAIGQSKGKFGGGKRTIWRQTQKKTPEGNKPSFATLTVIGNRNGYVGAGYGKARETVPARGKALRDAKLNLIKIKRGCGSWECHCGTAHSLPFKVAGKCGSVVIELMPAPKGTGLCIERECSKMLALAGVKDVYSKVLGHTGTKLNTIMACFDALQKISFVKIKLEYHKSMGIVEGKQ